MTLSDPSLAPLLGNPAKTWRKLDCLDARDSLLDYCGLIEIPGAPVDEDADDDNAAFQPIRQPPAAHHRLLISKLEDIEAGRIRRLMVFMPPGSAKSSYGSVVFPTWFMGRKKRRNVIVATYASDLARKIGRRARSILKQPVYSEIFGTVLSPDSSAADEWALTNDNEFMGGGILSGITGNRAAGLVIDDPVKGRQAADSPAIQKRTLDEYQDSLKTRLVPGGWVVLIQTRWNDNDLAGSILPKDYDGRSGPVLCRDGEVWEILNIPAQAERADDALGRKVGEYLWPEWFTEEHWAAFKSNPRTWAALYQQRPAADTGTFFKVEWFGRFSQAQTPKNLNIYMTSDHAPGGQTNNDFNCVRVWGIDPNQYVWMLDGYKIQSTIDKFMGLRLDPVTGEQTLADEGVLPLIKKWKPLCWFPEDDNNWKSAQPFVVAALRKHRIPCRIEALSTAGGDKPTKAQPIQAKASMGEVHLPIGPMGDEALEQYRRFPAGANDDDVDCAANIGRALDMAHPAIVKVKVNNPNPPDLGMFRKPPAVATWKTL